MSFSNVITCLGWLDHISDLWKFTTAYAGQLRIEKQVSVLETTEAAIGIPESTYFPSGVIVASILEFGDDSTLNV